MRIRNLTGKRFGRLVAIKVAKSDGQNKFWLCQCDCGKFTEVRAGHLISGQIFGCGCKQKLPKGEAAFNAVFASYQKQALARGLSFQLNKKQFRILVQEDCFYCGNPPSNKKKHGRCNGIYVYNGIDRIDNAKGYTLDNCVSCCGICNWMKLDLSMNSFLNHINKIAGISAVR